MVLTKAFVPSTVVVIGAAILIDTVILRRRRRRRRSVVEVSGPFDPATLAAYIPPRPWLGTALRVTHLLEPYCREACCTDRRPVLSKCASGIVGGSS